MFNFYSRVNIPLYVQNSEMISMYTKGQLTSIFSKEIPNLSSVFFRPETVKKYLKEDPTVTVIPKSIAYQYVEPEGYFFDGVYVEADLWKKGFDKNYLLQSFKPRNLYCSDYGFYKGLPQHIEVYAFEKKEESDCIVELPNSIDNFIELFANLHRFNRVGDRYIFLNEEDSKQNYLKYIQQYEIMKLVGNDGSRHADYGKIIQYLLYLQYSNMSTEDKAIFDPLLQESLPSKNSLQNIVNREVAIRKKLKELNEKTYSNINI